jgi:hypothetical protein
MDRHYENFIDFIKIRQKPLDGSFGIKDERPFSAQCLNALKLSMEIAIRFNMKLKSLGARVDKLLKIEIGARHHQMDVTVEVWRNLLRKRDNIWPEGKIGNKVRIHYVEMERIGPRRFGPKDFIGEAAEVGRQKRR